VKKFLKWVIFVLVISGWIAFGIGYMISQNKIKKLQDEITRLNSELTSSFFLVSWSNSLISIRPVTFTRAPTIGVFGISLPIVSIDIFVASTV